MPKVRGILAPVLHRLARTWVRKAEGNCVQPLSIEAEARQKFRVGTVEGVSDERMMLVRHMHPYLVSASRLKGDLNETGIAECLESAVMGNRVSSVCYDRELPIAILPAAERGIDSAVKGIELSLDERVVNLVHRAFFKCPFKLAVCALATRHDHQPARTNVETLHDAVSLCWPASGNANTERSEGPKDGWSAPAGCWMRDDADRFVDDDDIVVEMNDGHSINWRRGDAKGLRLAPRHVEHLASRNSVRFSERPPGFQNAASKDHVLSCCPAKP